jgi:hypothetical protein
MLLAHHSGRPLTLAVQTSGDSNSRFTHQPHCLVLLLPQMPLDDIQSLMDETAEAKEYQVGPAWVC